MDSAARACDPAHTGDRAINVPSAARPRSIWRGPTRHPTARRQTTKSVSEVKHAQAAGKSVKREAGPRASMLGGMTVCVVRDPGCLAVVRRRADRSRYTRCARRLPARSVRQEQGAQAPHRSRACAAHAGEWVRISTSGSHAGPGRGEPLSSRADCARETAYHRRSTIAFMRDVRTTNRPAFRSRRLRTASVGSAAPYPSVSGSHATRVVRIRGDGRTGQDPGAVRPALPERAACADVPLFDA